MPDPVPAVAAPAAAADPVQQPSAAAPAVETPPSPPKFESKKVAGELFKLLTAEAPDPTAPAPAKKDEPKPAATEPKKPEGAAPTAPAEKPIKVKKPKVVEETRPELPKKAERPAPAATPPPAAPPPAAPAQSDADFEKELVDEERALLDDARAAEKYLGDRYKGHGAKMTAFLKEAAKKNEAVEKGDLDETEFKEWYDKSRPKISALDFRAIERARVKEDVAAEFEPKLAQERHARWTEAEAPKVKAKGDAIYGKLINSALPDEVAAAIKERTKGITDRGEFVRVVQEVQKLYALETEITENIVSAATGDLEEFHRLTTVNPATGKSLTAFDGKNQQHNRIVQMVSDVCDAFKASGGTELKKDGKWFATRAEWSAMADAVREGTLPREELGKWWTFTNDEIADRALAGVKGVVTNAVAARRKEFEERYGYKRVIAQPAAPAAAAPTHQPAGAPPAPRPSMIPPPAGSAAPSLGARLAATLTTQPEG